VSGGRRIARNSAIFAIATGLSRIAGLAREILASSYFGTQGRFSAFTIAFQVPNLVRSLFADAAISAAFVPVFTELLEHGRKREAFRLAGSLFTLILCLLGGISALFILFAPVIMPLFVGDTFTQELTDLTVGLSRVLFPIVVLLGLNGLLVGILNAYDHFAIPAFAPLVWNGVIIVALVVLRQEFTGDDQMYAYAIGVLIGTIVQLGMCFPALARLDFRLRLAFDWRDPRVIQTLKLMLPVTLGLGIINFDLVINSVLGSLISEQAPRAIDAAFRIYMLPQGIFSVALATVLFPALARLAARGDIAGLRATMANGVRQIALMLIPMATITLVLAEPITRAVELLLEGHQQDFPVLDGRIGDQPIGILTRSDLLKAIAAGRTDARVGDVARRSCGPVGPDEMLEDVFRRMQENGCTAVPVVEPGRGIVGMVTLENVGEFAMVQAALSGRAPRGAPA